MIAIICILKIKGSCFYLGKLELLNDLYSQELTTASLVKFSSSPHVLSTFRDAKSSDQKIFKKLNFSDIISCLLPTCQVGLVEEL